MTDIFCPTCDALILDAPRCPACGKWERPPVPPAGRGARAWRAALPAALASSLTLADGVLYACDADGKLHALTAATGAAYWPQPADLGAWRIYRQVAAAGGLVLVGPDDGRSIPQADKAVLALDAASGAVRWRSPLNVSRVSDPAVAGDAVYVMTSDGHAVALALADGALRWRAPIRNVSQAAPAAAGDLVVYGGDKGTLTALAAADGRAAWTFSAEPDPQWGASFPYPPVHAEGRVYVTCWNRRCYALDAATGDVLWASDPTKRPPLTPPALHESSAYFCGHDRYVYCLDAADGALRWRTQLPRRSVTTPVVVAGQVFVVSQDHQVYALDAATGELDAAGLPATERRVEADWANDSQRVYLGDVTGQLYAIGLTMPAPIASPEALAGQGRWAEAAARYALTGNLCRAAEIYAAELAEPIHAARLWERAGETALAAAQFERGGELKAARALYMDLGQHERVAALSEALGDLPAAAQAYEQAERWEQAAGVYIRLGSAALPQAAHAFERAAEAASLHGIEKAAQGWWLKAAEAYQKLRQPEKAVQLYHRAGQKDRADYVIREERDPALKVLLKRLIAGPEELAQWFSEQGQYAAAAEEYIRLKRPIEAARSYERAKEYVLAAEQYRAAEQWADAGRMMEAAGNPGEAARLYEQAGELVRAAALYTQANQPGRAATLFERIGDWHAAAGQWAAAEHWEQAAQTWERAGDFRQAAAAYLKIGACFMAAECLWRAGQAAQKNGDLSNATAGLYEEAMTHYTDCGVYDRAQECDRLRRWLRKQPWLEVPLPQVEEFTPGEFGRIDIEVHNTGWGMARDITITVTGQFEPDLTRADKPFPLQNNYTSRRTIWVAPKRAGKQLPLHLTVTYQDAVSAPLPPLEISYDIVVRSKDERRSDSTPIIVQAGGKVIQMHEGDFIEGDQVKIQRSGAGPASQGAPAGAAQTSMPAPNLTCPACGTEQPADRARCSNPACGMPFVQCASCGYYQPARTKFCMHCRAAQA